MLCKKNHITNLTFYNCLIMLLVTHISPVLLRYCLLRLVKLSLVAKHSNYSYFKCGALQNPF